MKISGLHIEPTNICTLKCPRCARTKFLETFKQKNWKNQNLTLQDLIKFLDISLVDVRVLLCGNYGDPIYYSDLFEMIKFFKSKQSIINIITNGSYKDKQWWNELVGYLDSRDTITFSVDGTPENFTNYRINADWQSILTGMQTVANSSVNSVWKFIPFNYNEHSIEAAKKISEEIGITKFDVDPSDRWDSLNDPFMPSNSNYRGPRNENIVKWKYHKDHSQQIDPKCKNNSQHFISSNGFYVPCCYMNDYRFYYKSKFYKEKNLYNIKTTTISKILNQVHDFLNSIEQVKPMFCTFNCAKASHE